MLSEWRRRGHNDVSRSGSCLDGVTPHVFWRFADKKTKTFGGKAVKSPRGFSNVDCLFLLAGTFLDFAEGDELGVWSSAVCFPQPCGNKNVAVRSDLHSDPLATPNY